MGNECVCERCRHVWNRNTENPVRCPRCGTYYWNMVPTTNQCRICNHKWFSRTEKVPARCPSCKTRSWSLEKASVSRPKVTDEREDHNIMSLYASGIGCVRISIETGLSLAAVRDVVKRNIPSHESPRM